MAGGSVETTLELWASSLRAVKGRIRPLFLQERMAQSAGLFLDVLLGPERRKTGWMRAEAAGDPGPWRQQALLGRAQWDADALRDVVRDYAVETLASPDAVLVVERREQAAVRGQHPGPLREWFGGQLVRELVHAVGDGAGAETGERREGDGKAGDQDTDECGDPEHDAEVGDHVGGARGARAA